MRKTRFTEEQIIGILKEAEAGLKVPKLCRKHAISDVTFYKWRSKFGGPGGLRGPALARPRRGEPPSQTHCRRAGPRTSGRSRMLSPWLLMIVSPATSSPQAETKTEHVARRITGVKIRFMAALQVVWESAPRAFSGCANTPRSRRSPSI